MLEGLTVRRRCTALFMNLRLIYKRRTVARFRRACDACDTARKIRWPSFVIRRHRREREDGSLSATTTATGTAAFLFRIYLFPFLPISIFSAVAFPPKICVNERSRRHRNTISLHEHYGKGIAASTELLWRLSQLLSSISLVLLASSPCDAISSPAMI